ncbi:MAG TPA: hypothetical protein VHH32_01355 [Gemmatimonadales bacterium]|nr:hypothetical protein [Gemmatimonadales bacterium]
MARFITREEGYDWSSAFGAHTMGTTHHRWSSVQHSFFSRTGRRGITVLALLLLIIAVVVLAFLLIRYLRTDTAAEQSLRTDSSLVVTASAA